MWEEGKEGEKVTGNVLFSNWTGRLKSVHFIILHNLHTCEIYVFVCMNTKLKWFFKKRILVRGFCVPIRDVLLPVIDANHLKSCQTHKSDSLLPICYLQSCQLDFTTATYIWACATAVFSLCSKWISYFLRSTAPREVDTSRGSTSKSLLQLVLRAFPGPAVFLAPL